MVFRVAGAGLTGMTAAITAAKLGESVEVFDAKTRHLPSSGPHSEGVRNYLERDALDELRAYGFELEPFTTITATIRRSPNFENELSGPAYYMFLRGREPESVDQRLHRRALDLGVQFHFGEAAPSDVNVIATGPPRARTNLIGAGFTFSAEGADLDRRTVYALLDNRAAPAGYLVISPGIEFHSMYSVSWGELDYERLLPRFEDAIRAPWIQDILGSSTRLDKIFGRAFYAEDPLATAVQGGRLFAGEAGGFQDAVAGFGFRYAVITAALAARAAVESLDYPALLRQAFGDEFRDAWAYRQKLAHASNEDFDKLVRELGPRTTVEEHRELRQRVRLL